MNFFYFIVISPIETVVDWVFTFIINKVDSIGVIGAVFGVSLAINFLALPLYNIADSLQEKERRVAKSLEYRVGRIKKAFKGDEQFMMLTEYYRQNNYHPLYVLRSSLSILIEIPFFIAAYHYLSHNEMLSGASWWIFKDLGSPDEFFSISIGSFSLGIHILPVIMTLINFVSGAIYTKDATFREKAQLYVVATIFLVLLYNSPSGLVIYWILNNIFSLVKNIVMKMKNPVRILHAAVSAVFVLLALFVCSRHGSLVKKAAMVLFAFFVAALPVAASVFRKVAGSRLTVSSSVESKSSFSLLLFSGLGLALLCGFMLPSAVISTSPAEFSFLGKTLSPVSYIWSSFFVFFGFFVFWPVAIYKMFGDKVRRVTPLLFFAVFVCALANVYVFKHSYGNMNVSFTLDDGNVLKKNGFFLFVMPIFALGLALACLFAFHKFRKLSVLSFIVFSVCLAEGGLGFFKTNEIKRQFELHSENLAEKAEVKSGALEIKPVYHLSRSGKNVIVLFLDRGISSLFPVILNDFGLEDSFAGFTYYPNTLSFSTHTSVASPAMMGGYEYSLENINARGDELLRLKHNEAMLAAPKLFADAGFEVTVTDPPWSNYAHEGDYTPFEKHPEINAFRTFGKYTDLYFKELGIPGGQNADKADIICRKEIRNFSVIQILYPPVRSTFYRLCRANNLKDDRNFYDIFSSLYFLDRSTDFTSKKNTFFFIDNDTPHEPHALENNYTMISGKEVSLERAHYDVNAASLIQVAKFLDYLRTNGVYDNTRIIIVADHGNNLKTERFSAFAGMDVNPAYYNPLFAVKDFDSKEPLSVSEEFMTNADTIFEARKNLDVPSVNPFTGRELVQQKENGITVYPLSRGEHHADQLMNKSRFTLDESRAYHVSGDISKTESWVPLSRWKQDTNGGSR